MEEDACVRDGLVLYTRVAAASLILLPPVCRNARQPHRPTPLFAHRGVLTRNGIPCFWIESSQLQPTPHARTSPCQHRANLRAQDGAPIQEQGAAARDAGVDQGGHQVRHDHGPAQDCEEARARVFPPHPGVHGRPQGLKGGMCVQCLGRSCRPLPCECFSSLSERQGTAHERMRTHIRRQLQVSCAIWLA